MKKLTPPNYCRNAVPTESGWRHPQSNELLVAVNIKQEQINEYMGITSYEDMSKKELEAEGRELGIELDRRKSHEDLIADLKYHIENGAIDFENMTKRELEELGREHGIELDRRHSKKVLIQELKEAIED